ncbi:MAG: type II toxin-antitoxin system HicA family toxin [Candidatus Korobacteraceae bacterium]
MPRDLSGSELAKLLRRYGYQITRQTGSHLRLTSSTRGTQHHIAIPVPGAPLIRDFRMSGCPQGSY